MADDTKAEGAALAAPVRIDMNTVGRIRIDGPSLLDVMRWEALPDDVRALARLVLFGHVGEPATVSLQAAYEAGWEDGGEAVEIERRSPSKFDFERWLKAQVGGQRGAA